MRETLPVIRGVTPGQTAPWDPDVHSPPGRIYKKRSFMQSGRPGQENAEGLIRSLHIRENSTSDRCNPRRRRRLGPEAQIKNLHFMHVRWLVPVMFLSEEPASRGKREDPFAGLLALRVDSRFQRVLTGFLLTSITTGLPNLDAVGGAP